MSDVGSSNKLNSLTNFPVPKSVSPDKNAEPGSEKVSLSSLQISEKVDVSKDTAMGSAITNLEINEKSTVKLPEIDVKVDGNFTFYTNSYGTKITAHKTDTGISYNTFSDKGLSIILKDNKDIRDVLVFSAMTDKVPNNSSIPDNYFHVNAECDKNPSLKQNGKCESRMYFDKEQNIVIELNDKNKLVIDGKDAQTVLEGPFKINFNPDSDGHDFKVNYSGTDNLKRFTSHGGNIKF